MSRKAAHFFRGGGGRISWRRGRRDQLVTGAAAKRGKGHITKLSHGVDEQAHN